MLQSIRDKTSGWIATVILGLIIIGMAFFGVESYFSPTVETWSARIVGPAKFWVFGAQEAEISQQDFRRRWDRTREQERQRAGEQFDNAAFDTPENRRLLLDRMIDEEVLALVAEREGIAVGDAEVAKELQAMPAFQIDGKYSPDQYRLALATQQMTHAQFFELVRTDMIRQTIAAEVGATGLASLSEVESFLTMSQQTRDLRLLEVPAPTFDGQMPSEAELAEWHKKNSSRYETPEQVEVEFIEIDASTLPLPAPPDDATLRQRYDAQGTRYVTAEQRIVSHILVKVPANADAAAEQAAQQRAAGLAAQARAEGADFAALAATHSEDLGSKDLGGDLGSIEKGLFDPVFESAVFALQPGQVSDPVRGSEGWHVIKLRELVPGSAKPFEEVRAELEAEFVAAERERAFSELSGQLVDLIYKDPTALLPAARALNLPIQRSGLFSRSEGTGVAALEQVRAAAFSDSQRIERQVSDRIEIGEDHVIVVHVIEHKPAAVIPLDQIKDRVQADLLADRMSARAKAEAEALLERVRKGETLDALAAELARQIVPLEGVARNMPQVPPPLLEGAFRLSAPVGDKVDVGLVELSKDQYALIAVTAVKPGDLSTLDETVRTSMRDQLARMRAQVETQALTEALRKQYTITVAEDRL